MRIVFIYPRNVHKICQALCNKLHVYDFTVEFRCINWLERVLIARRLQLKKETIMPKNQSPKFKGAICNVPIDAFMLEIPYLVLLIVMA